MIVQALSVAAATYVIKFFGMSFANLQLRPILIGPIIGLILGDFTQGIIIGTSLGAVFLGGFGVGGSLPSDTDMGAIVGTSFAILAGNDVKSAVALAVPVGLLSIFVYNLIKIVWHNAVVAIADNAVAQHNDKRYEHIHYAAIIFFGIPYAIISFTTIMIGVEPISQLMNSLPEVVNNFLSIASKLLPAMGFGMLLKSLWDKDLVPYFFSGFALAAYFGLDTMGIALVGTILAVLYGYNFLQKQTQDKKIAEATTSSRTYLVEAEDPDDDFFN
ncbi:PTS sugar transporter subunit IIC [Enterococcus sp. OL5]|uniref:PTS sugar transporter subunit IIC n=1 Tax=Enterococcus sp. OL5 TaxID=2590214 RepID=UPI0016793049|nr:PTS sugar transporter subunit IIC [Enterococcus sp. OL5]